MSRNNRKRGTQQSTDDQKKPFGGTNRQVIFEKKDYDDQYPPLSASATDVTPNEPSVAERVCLFIF